MGFNVVAWESGFFECEEMEHALRAGESVEDARWKGLPSVLADGPFIAPIFAYAQSTYGSRHPLRMTGFDIQPGNRTRVLAADRALSEIERLISSKPQALCPLVAHSGRATRADECLL